MAERGKEEAGKKRLQSGRSVEGKARERKAKIPTTKRIEAESPSATYLELFSSKERPESYIIVPTPIEIGLHTAFGAFFLKRSPAP